MPVSLRRASSRIGSHARGPSNTARTPSPVVLMSRPRYRSIDRATRSSCSSRSSRQARSPRREASSVDPTMSLNMMVARARSTFTPPRTPVKNSSISSSKTFVSPTKKTKSSPGIRRVARRGYSPRGTALDRRGCARYVDGARASVLAQRAARPGCRDVPSPPTAEARYVARRSRDAPNGPTSG